MIMAPLVIAVRPSWSASRPATTEPAIPGDADRREHDHAGFAHARRGAR